MIETKLIEVRDRATFIPCIASRMKVCTDRGHPEYWEKERYLLGRVGYRGDSCRLVLFTYLQGGRLAEYDPEAWGLNPRTIPVAHDWVEKHWFEISSGDVVDVEFILGETTTKKVSERLA